MTVRFRIHRNPDADTPENMATVPDDRIDPWELCVYDENDMPACVATSANWTFLVSILNRQADDQVIANVQSFASLYRPELTII